MSRRERVEGLAILLVLTLAYRVFLSDHLPFAVTLLVGSLGVLAAIGFIVSPTFYSSDDVKQDAWTVVLTALGPAPHEVAAIAREIDGDLSTAEVETQPLPWVVCANVSQAAAKSLGVRLSDLGASVSVHGPEDELNRRSDRG